MLGDDRPEGRERSMFFVYSLRIMELNTDDKHISKTKMRSLHFPLGHTTRMSPMLNENKE